MDALGRPVPVLHQYDRYPEHAAALLDHLAAAP